MLVAEVGPIEGLAGLPPIGHRSLGHGESNVEDPHVHRLRHVVVRTVPRRDVHRPGPRLGRDEICQDHLRPALQERMLRLHWELEDRGITLESVRRFEAALERLGKNYEIHVYEGAGHAFANPSGNNFNAEYADDAWNRTLDFLREHLAADSG